MAGQRHQSLSPQNTQSACARVLPDGHRGNENTKSFWPTDFSDSHRFLRTGDGNSEENLIWIIRGGCRFLY